MRWIKDLWHDTFKVITIVLLICWSYFAYYFGHNIYKALESKVFYQEEIIVFVDKTSNKTDRLKKTFTKILFDNTDPYYKDIVTKKDVLNKLRSSSALKVISTARADTYLLSMILIILFLFWIIPLLTLLLLVIYLRGSKISPIYD